MATVTGAKSNKVPVIWRIVGIPDPPPELTMLLNPGNLDTSYTHLVNETRTLGGFLQEYWGEQLTSLSASGRSAMFYGTGGISNKESKLSTAYENFKRLVNIYRNNGKSYQPVHRTAAQYRNPNRITAVGTVIMTYHEKEYEGFFDSFSIRELAERPFYFEYDLSFRVTRVLGDLVVESGTFTRAVRNG